MRMVSDGKGVAACTYRKIP